MSTLSQFAQTGKIKSIQRGVVTLFAGSSSVIIAAVDTSKSILYHLGQSTAATSSALSTAVNVDTYLTLTSSTTITVNGVGGTGFNQIVSWQLVEYY